MFIKKKKYLEAIQLAEKNGYDRILCFLGGIQNIYHRPVTMNGDDSSIQYSIFYKIPETAVKITGNHSRLEHCNIEAGKYGVWYQQLADKIGKAIKAKNRGKSR